FMSYTTYTRSGWTEPVDTVESDPRSPAAEAAAAAITAACNAAPPGAILVPRKLRAWFTSPNSHCTEEFIQGISGLRAKFDGTNLLLAAANPTLLKRAEITAEDYFDYIRERVKVVKEADVRMERNNFVTEFEVSEELLDLARCRYSLRIARVDGIVKIQCPSVNHKRFKVIASEVTAAIKARSMLDFVIEEVEVPTNIPDQMIKQIVEDSCVAKIDVPESDDRFIITGSRFALKAAKLLIEQRISWDE
ncbi:hypothetical protein PMAYCL1PPCAC_00576, partial [Pristionchus mayeri]